MPPENGSSSYDDSTDKVRTVQPTSQYAGRIANPAPLGLSAFALTAFVLSCYNTGNFGVGKRDPSNVVVGLALFYGGIIQMLAGMWEFKTGNTFSATAFTSYGGFWLSFAVILIPGFGVLDAFRNTPDVVNSAMGIFLLGWTIFTLLMLFVTLRISIGLIALFSLTGLTFLLLTIGKFRNKVIFDQVAGYTGIATAIAAWYNAMADLLSHHNAVLTLPVGRMRG